MADEGIGGEDTAACRNPTHSAIELATIEIATIELGYRRTPEAPS